MGRAGDSLREEKSNQGNGGEEDSDMVQLVGPTSFLVGSIKCSSQIGYKMRVGVSWVRSSVSYIGNEFKLASSRRGLGFYHSRNLAQPSPSASAAAMAQEVSFTLNGAILLGADILLFPLLQHVADLSSRETLARITGGIKVKADRDESSPYAAMLAAQDVVQQFKELGITALHIKL
ncbi:hypothetical protein ZIOFF_066684 [Zingiber officinale]|uniref:Uncharacterized protein n=1 Tax=Zingiber officinale TaxID=94328 RepID=A0A8J5EYL0_ZINOF|nr:hypothetical protein ZIOFF_066684 [Zingiber officinale]